MTFPAPPRMDAWFAAVQAAVSSTVGEGSALWVYGHSYTADPGLMCTVGGEFFHRIKNRWGAASVTSYGVTQSRLIDNVQDILGHCVVLPRAGSTWDGTRRGVVVLDSLFNDAQNMGPNTTPTLLSEGQVETYRHCLRTALAALRSTPVDTGPTSGSWATYSYAGCVGGADKATTQQGASISTDITVPEGAGTVWVLDYTYVTSASEPTPHATVRIDVDGAQAATVTSADFPTTCVYSTRGNYPSARSTIPQVTKLTGLTPGVHTVTQTKTDAGPDAVFSDGLLVEVAHPVPVLLLVDPEPDPDRWGAPGWWYETYAANRNLLLPVLASVAAEFDNVIVVNPGLDPAADLGVDGIHPNDSGMRKIADALTLARADIPDSPGLYTTP